MTLKVGSTGPLVKEAQTKLNEKTIIPYGTAPLVADGNFGAKTEAMVKLFQFQKGMTQSGVIDNATAVKLGMFAVDSPSSFTTTPPVASTPFSPNLTPVSSGSKESFFTKYKKELLMASGVMAGIFGLSLIINAVRKSSGNVEVRSNPRPKKKKTGRKTGGKLKTKPKKKKTGRKTGRKTGGKLKAKSSNYLSREDVNKLKAFFEIEQGKVKNLVNHGRGSSILGNGITALMLPSARHKNPYRTYLYINGWTQEEQPRAIQEMIRRAESKFPEFKGKLYYEHGNMD